MPHSIRYVRPATSREWDEAWQSCAWSTFFHSRTWSEVWDVASRGALRPGALRAEFSDGSLALLPLTWKTRLNGMIRTALCSPAETFGGWLSATELGADKTVALARVLAERTGNLKWKLNPFDPTSPRSLPGIIEEPDETLALDLNPGFEALRSRWTKGHRAAATQAERQGVRIRQADKLEDWRTYYTVYQDSIRRWGAEALQIQHPWALFEELSTRGAKGVRLWLAEHDGSIIAGALCLEAPRHIAYWHGAVLENQMKHRPVNLLLQEAIRDACARPDVRWFDFGSSGPLKGVRSFKKSFGAQSLPCPTVRLESEIRRLARLTGRTASRVLERWRPAAASHPTAAGPVTARVNAHSSPAYRSHEAS